jgi:hypothetical protein
VTGYKAVTVTATHQAILDLPNVCDSTVFIRTLQHAKAEVKTLLDADEYEQASSISSELHSVFYRLESLDVDVLKDVIHLFPANKRCTLGHLGKSDEVDQTIFSSKLSIDDLQFEEKGWQSLLKWAREREDHALIERIVFRIAENVRATATSAYEGRPAAMTMLYFLIRADLTPLKLSEPVDNTIAGLIGAGIQLPSRVELLPGMARSGLKRSIMAMIRQEVIRLPFYFVSKDDTCVIHEALPATPSPEEAYYILRATDLPGLKERVLFDPEFDLDAYISVLEHNKGMCPGALGVFSSLMTPEHLTSPERRRRATRLIDAVCDWQAVAIGKKPDEIRAMLLNEGMHPITMKISRILKVSMLEDELGM